MADSKISALPASTTPLAGTEVLPIVQSSTTKQVSVANLTAGRAVSALSIATTTGATFATTSGSVGIGTASPNAILHTVKATSGISAAFDNGGQSVTEIDLWNNGVQKSAWYYDNSAAMTYLYTIAGAGIGFSANATERMRITSAGDLCVNRTSAIGAGKVNIDFSGAVGQGLAINDTASQNGGQFEAFYYGAGTFLGSISNVSNTAVAYNTTSDYRLKENIAPMTGALSTVAQLKPSTYKWKINGSDGQGFIAHELAEVVPDCVNGEKDAVDADGKPKYQGVDTSFLVATLTCAIQEQQVLIESLTTRLTALENK